MNSKETHPGMPPERESVMAALSARLLPILGDKQKADEYAFNCSDIYYEVLQFNWLIENILNKEAASEDDLVKIQRLYRCALALPCEPALQCD